MEKTTQGSGGLKSASTTEKKAWIAPALIEESVAETKGGSITDIFENSFYHT
ncbi:MAG: hypothetical protein J0H46_03595 [Bacteroidetes bacterium]|nr:hypothetical protein [Bacteroidota bacterium]